MTVKDYRLFQEAVIPGLDGLHRSIRAIADVSLGDGARILVAGAGGGRELETLGASPRNYRLVGVDPSPEMLALARSLVGTAGSGGRVDFVEGLVDDLPADLFDAATSLFVMHFLADDGSKARYLSQVRRRLRKGGLYLHADVCFDERADYERLAPIYARQAEIGGLPHEEAQRVAASVGQLPVISEDELLRRLAEAGFRPVARFFEALWYVGWWTEAAD